MINLFLASAILKEQSYDNVTWGLQTANLVTSFPLGSCKRLLSTSDEEKSIIPLANPLRTCLLGISKSVCFIEPV